MHAPRASVSSTEPRCMRSSVTSAAAPGASVPSRPAAPITFAGASVDHERQPSRGRGLKGRAEGESGVAARLLARQSDFHAADEVAVGLDGLEGLGPVDEADVLELADLGAQHAGTADVEERENARFRHLDHVLAEPGERERPRRARVDDGGGAGRQTVRIRLDAVVRGAVVDVDVEIDEAGCHEEASGVDDLLARARPEVLAESGHAPVGEPNVPRRGGPECRVDDGPALDQHRRGPDVKREGGGARLDVSWRAEATAGGRRSQREGNGREMDGGQGPALGTPRITRSSKAVTESALVQSPTRPDRNRLSR